MGEGFFSPGEMGSLHVLPRLPACDKCGLFRGCRSPKMKPYGAGKKRVMIVAESPGAEEDDPKHGRPFMGNTGQYLEGVLRDCGIDMFRDCLCANAASCRPPDNDLPEAAIEHCRPKIVREIEDFDPVVLILLGKVPVKSVIGHLWKENVKGIFRWAGFQIPCQKWNCWITPTFHPSYVVRQRDNNDRVPEFFFRKHLRDALNVAVDPSGRTVPCCNLRPWNPVPDYAAEIDVELNPDKACKWLSSYVTERGFAFDIETTCLKPDGPHAEIVCCSVSTEHHTIAFPWAGSVVPTFLEYLSDPAFPKFGWNMKFESRWMKALHGVTVRGWKMDGMLGCHALDNRSGITSLKFQAFSRLGVPDYDSEIKPFLKGVPEGGNSKNRVREVPLKDLLVYCAYDSLLEYKLDHMIAEELGVPLCT